MEVFLSNTIEHLFIAVVPDITFPPDSSFTYTVNEFHPVIFTCSATGFPPPALSWYHNGALLSYDQTNTRITLGNPTNPALYSSNGGDIFLVSRNLTLDNAMDMDSGVYTCEASNGITVNPRVVQDFQLFVRGKDLVGFFISWHWLCITGKSIVIPLDNGETAGY